MQGGENGSKWAGRDYRQVRGSGFQGRRLAAARDHHQLKARLVVDCAALRLLHSNIHDPCQPCHSPDGAQHNRYAETPQSEYHSVDWCCYRSLVHAGVALPHPLVNTLLSSPLGPSPLITASRCFKMKGGWSCPRAWRAHPPSSTLHQQLRQASPHVPSMRPCPTAFLDTPCTPGRQIHDIHAHVTHNSTSRATTVSSISSNAEVVLL